MSGRGKAPCPIIIRGNDGGIFWRLGTAFPLGRSIERIDSPCNRRLHDAISSNWPALPPVPWHCIPPWRRAWRAPLRSGRARSSRGRVPPYRVGKWLPSDQAFLDRWLAKQLQAVRENPQPLQPVVQEFQDLIESDAELFMYFHQMFEELRVRAISHHADGRSAGARL